MSTEEVEVDLTDQMKESMIITYAMDNLSDASREVFLDELWDNSGPHDPYNKKFKIAEAAMGAAVVNEVANNIFKDTVEEEERKQGVFYFF